MYLRKIPQLKTVLITMIAAIAQMLVSTAVMAASDQPLVQLPREILPWRKDIEHQARRMLQTARQSLRTGDDHFAVEQLRSLLRKYPNSHAAGDARQQLVSQRQQTLRSAKRQGLGVLIGPEGEVKLKSPVAGWGTTVRPSPSRIREGLIEAAGDRVFFAEGSVKLNRSALIVLKKQASWLKRHRQIEVRVTGHADDKGLSQRNMRLSHDRAVAVRRHLIRFGVSPRRLHVFSHGNAKPIAICSAKTCAKQNRRVVTEPRISRRSAKLR